MAKKTEFQKRVSMLRKVDNYLKAKENENKEKKGKKPTKSLKHRKPDGDTAESE